MSVRWKRSPQPVTVRVTDRIEDLSLEELFINESFCEGCEAYPHTRTEVLIYHHNQEYSISGQMCVKSDGSLYVTKPGELSDASYEFIQYELPISNGSRSGPVQPRYIMLQSQLETLNHYFVHWNVSGRTVKCQQLPKYDSDGPHVDVNDDIDRRFVWVVPLGNSNQISLKSYGFSYYLAFESDGKAILHEDGAPDHDNSIRLKPIQ